jgi:2-polyprenyl-3-methyl-5-hydroxy-6-metoxy-1,4-benzoquinol methylase
LQVNVRQFNLDGLEELREKWIDEDIPKEELQFTNLVRKGFDKIYKVYSPNQMPVILNIIKKIRKMENRETLTLALLDFVS